MIKICWPKDSHPGNIFFAQTLYCVKSEIAVSRKDAFNVF